jgi:hypothetical protein
MIISYYIIYPKKQHVVATDKKYGNGNTRNYSNKNNDRGKTEYVSGSSGGKYKSGRKSEGNELHTKDANNVLLKHLVKYSEERDIDTVYIYIILKCINYYY